MDEPANHAEHKAYRGEPANQEAHAIEYTKSGNKNELLKLKCFCWKNLRHKVSPEMSVALFKIHFQNVQSNYVPAIGA